MQNYFKRSFDTMKADGELIFQQLYFVLIFNLRYNFFIKARLFDFKP
ncbi:hypothetical protein LEP1GSC083_0138 [Leptospira interrogans serovar Pyrogenes str. L0374]|uniref:Uncharacterized protein n=2 Tax=Leptospira interrogans TaxID=173 RepID=M6KM62_LEPIR|nr:hypothetical protein LEP1GSC045_1135 [Leptospira interrogans serovar Pomona str. Kennewicki LC82-25]EKN97590.1 hypothetical protein LEP1GSC014_4213 [Leptospira interrogans serovar Pomona str. Pomona]EKO04556.1 hypothetical protein LEP1GSC077_4608 [Leptospira interrogans str. C10069]EKO68722.1 hypothetical protein LEP1GSC069_3103 [Leptospira interrogans serovar Canicola str. Fiocruz LV133]EKR38147.1 hypothetical protein LEP1GSC096_0705 [Leptospira interrogans serovar Hebdomadis str. R499]EMF